jgi:hypothetical protein
MLESPIKPFSFSYSTYKNIINHKYQIGLDSKIGFGGIDLLINNKYTPSNLVKFKMGLFGKKVFYKNKFPFISNNVKFFLTPEMNIGNKNICLKTRYFTAFKKDSNYFESSLKYQKNIGTNYFSFKCIYNCRFIKNKDFYLLPEKLINRLFYRNNIGISKYV